MNTPPGSEEKPLNLAKFNPSANPAPAPDSPTADGETMFIKRATAAAVEEKLPVDEQATTEFGLPVKEMLGIITYCYSRGIFNSGEIANRLKHEPELRKAVGRNLPDEAAIRRFRRKYACEIEDALELLFQAFPRQASTAASESENLAHRLAGERVHEAIWTDNKLPGHPLRD